MGVLALFESSHHATGARPSGRGRANDIGRLSRERRLAYYLSACQALGVDPGSQSLRFVRCNDGRLRLYVPSHSHELLRRMDSSTALSVRLERELAAAAAAVAAGGGISYEIELESGDLRVREVVRASRLASPTMPPGVPSRRYGSYQRLASARIGAR